MTGHDDDHDGRAPRRAGGGWGGKLIIGLLVLEALVAVLYFGGYWNGSVQASGASTPVTVSGAGGYVPDLGGNPASAATAATAAASGVVAPAAVSGGTFRRPAG